MAINKVEFGDQTLIDLTSDTVTQQDVLNGKTFHSADGVVRSGTATIPVTDVEVNGTSVVNQTVAEITSYEEVTLAEYEALPSSKLTNGVAYFIKDLNNDSVQGYPPLIYSDQEREVGVWRDGKPLYQKTINLGRLTFDSNWHSVNHNISNVETIVNVKGILVSAVSPYYCYPIPAYRPSITQGVIVGGNSTAIQYINNWQSDDHTAYITIQYTKTTDVAGSGIWNGQGGLAHHYSTNETVVGTWIDGKPLYERTKVVPFTNFTHNNDTYFTPIASDNTETLRNVEAIAYSTGYGVCTLGSRAYSRDNTLSYYWELVEYYSNIALHFIGESATDVGVTEVVITYQYTKTTD